MNAANLKKRLAAMPAAAKASLALMLTEILSKGFAILTAPIYTRLMSQTEYGVTTLFFSWYDILVIFTGLCLCKGVFNNGMLEFKGDRNRFTFSLSALACLSSAVIGTGVMLYCKYVDNFLNLPLDLLFFMFLLLFAEEAMAIWCVRQRFEFKYKALTAVNLSLAVTSPILGIVCILLFPGAKSYAWIIGGKILYLLANFFFLLYNGIKAKFQVRPSYWGYALKFNLPLIPHYLSLHVLNHMDRIQIASICSEAHAAIYTVAYSGASVVKLFWQGINASLIPWTYEQCEKKQFQRIADLTKILIALYGLICLIFMFLAPELMLILAPESYSGGIYIIPSVIAGVFFSALYYIFANVVYYYKKPKYVMLGSVLSAVANVTLNAIFIPRYGYLAAGYTTMVSYFLQVVIDYLALHRIMGRDIYDMKFIWGFSACMVAIACSLSFVYTLTWLRMVLLAVVLAFACFYGKKHQKTLLSFMKKKGND